MATREDVKKKLNERFKKLSSEWLTKKQAEEQIRGSLKKAGTFDTLKTWLAGDIKKSQEEKVLSREELKKRNIERDIKFKETTPKDTTAVVTTEPTPPVEEEITEDVVEEEAPIEVIEEEKTLRERVKERVSWKKTAEEKLKEAREEEWRAELVEQRRWFREQALAVTEDLENITKWLEAEWGAITKIAASRIREARSAPLREQLSSFVKWLELTSDNITELDTSIEAILKARAIDRQNEVNNLTAEIEWSDLSTEEKNKLIWQLWEQTKRMKLEEENEAFRQKEQIKSDIKRADEESLASTWLTTQQNLTLWKILTNAELKEDSVIAKSVWNLLKEWKTEAEINKILALSTDEEWNFVSDTQFNRREKWRKEFESKVWVKNFRSAAVQFAWLKDNIDDLTWAADIAVLFSFMKTLDPTSVVRESEFNSIANSAWVGDKVDLWNMLQWVKEWAKLWDLESGQREAVKAVAQTLFEKQQTNYLWLAKNQIKQALRDWVDPRSVVLDLDEYPELLPFVTELNIDEENEIDNVFWGTESTSGKQFKFDDDITFSKADQTATPKGKIGWILWPLQNKVTVVEKWWDNTVLWLSGWSLTFRTNNPLAITATWAWTAERLTNKFNAIPNLFSPDSADNLVLNFKTEEEWLRAWRQLLESKWNLSINKLMESHTWTSATWHKAQARKLWLDLNRTYASLSQAEKNKVIEAIKIGEWFRKWTIIS